jgi:hypothetical protein
MAGKLGSQEAGKQKYWEVRRLGSRKTGKAGKLWDRKTEGFYNHYPTIFGIFQFQSLQASQPPSFQAVLPLSSCHPERIKPCTHCLY